MNDVKLLNRALWGLNLLLGAGIVVFSFQYLLRAADPREYLRDFKAEDDTPTAPTKTQDTSDGALKSLPNPVEKRLTNVTGPTETLFKATLKGTLPSEKDPRQGVAFIRSTGRNVDLVAFVGEEILHEGKAFDEFRGWALSTVAKDRALFVSRSGQKAEITIDQTITAPPGGATPAAGAPGAKAVSKIGAAYVSDTYKSRLLAQADTRQVWGMDQDEIAWAAANAEQIMDRDFQVAPYAGGGLRIESVTPGSIGAARGMLAGDVLREVNGQPLNNIADVRTLMNNPAFQQQTGLRLTIERAGKPVVLEYRPLPR